MSLGHREGLPPRTPLIRDSLRRLLQSRNAARLGGLVIGPVDRVGGSEAGLA
jgi:hypothetical protein